MSFSQRFTALMESKGITPYRMSKDTGIPEATIGRWKNGKAIPAGDKLVIVVKYLDTSADYLLLDDSQKEKPSAGAEDLSEESKKLLQEVERLNPANRAKLEELCRLFLADQDKSE